LLELSIRWDGLTAFSCIMLCAAQTLLSNMSVCMYITSHGRGYNGVRSTGPCPLVDNCRTTGWRLVNWATKEWKCV